MKNITKKIVVTLTSLLMASSMVVGASAASVAFGTSSSPNSCSSNVIVSSNGSGCQSGFDVNSFWGGINSSGASDNSSNCSQLDSSSYDSFSDVLNSYMSAATNVAKQNSNCSPANGTNNSNCAAANTTNTPAAAAAQSDNSTSTVKTTTQKSNCNTNAAGNTTKSSCPTADSKTDANTTAKTDASTTTKSNTTSNCTTSDCAANNCTANNCTTGNCNTGNCDTGNCNTGNCTSNSNSSFTACKKSITDLLNNLFAKCGINICLPGCYGSTDTTGTPEPSPSDEPTATPQPTQTPAPTSTPAPTPTPTPTSTPDTTVPSDNGSDTTGNTEADNLSFEKQVVALVNEQRAAYGLAPLTLSTELSNVARAKSQDMHDNNYFDHTSPTYGSPFEMMSSFGISYRTAGENIAMGYTTPEAVMNAWMNSSGHRANILNASYTQIGVGYVADGNYWTQEFIG